MLRAGNYFAMMATHKSVPLSKQPFKKIKFYALNYTE